MANPAIDGLYDVVETSAALAHVKYEIRGQLAHRAHDVSDKIDSLLSQHT